MSFYNLSEKTKRHSDVSGYDYITIQDTGKSSNLQNQFGRVERDFTFTLLDQSSRGFLCDSKPGEIKKRWKSVERSLRCSKIHVEEKSCLKLIP